MLICNLYYLCVYFVCFYICMRELLFVYTYSFTCTGHLTVKVSLITLTNRAYSVTNIF